MGAADEPHAPTRPRMTTILYRRLAGHFPVNGGETARPQAAAHLSLARVRYLWNVPIYRGEGVLQLEPAHPHGEAQAETQRVQQKRNQTVAQPRFTTTPGGPARRPRSPAKNTRTGSGNRCFAALRGVLGLFLRQLRASHPRAGRAWRARVLT
jgi:hypothetical protein